MLDIILHCSRYHLRAFAEFPTGGSRLHERVCSKAFIAKVKNRDKPGILLWWSFTPNWEIFFFGFAERNSKKRTLDALKFLEKFVLGADERT